MASDFLRAIADYLCPWLCLVGLAIITCETQRATTFSNQLQPAFFSTPHHHSMGEFARKAALPRFNRHCNELARLLLFIKAGDKKDGLKNQSS